jgi:hypothetical protein
MSTRWIVASFLASFAVASGQAHAADVVRTLVPAHIEWCAKTTVGLESLQTIDGSRQAYDSAAAQLTAAARIINVAAVGRPYANGFSSSGDSATVTFCAVAPANAPADRGVTSVDVAATFFLGLVCADDATDECHNKVAEYVQQKNGMTADAVDQLDWHHIKTLASGDAAVVIKSALLDSSEFAVSDAPPTTPQVEQPTSTVVAVRDPGQAP